MVNVGPLRGQTRAWFTVREVGEKLGYSPPYARLFCSRNYRTGVLLRVRRDLYTFPDTFKSMDEHELFCLANVIQTPSYISLLSAMSQAGLTTHLAAATVESVNPVRSRNYTVAGVQFRFYFVGSNRYFGYQRTSGVFFAEPEKALLDAIYLASFGRYAIDMNALVLRDIRWSQIEKWLRKYPDRTRAYYRNWRERYENIAAA